MSIYSMTGFASISQDIQGITLCLELRAVNHRYLDLQLRLPEELRLIEPQLREAIVTAVSRGKVECRALITHSNAVTHRPLEVDYDLLRHLLSVSEQINTLASSATALSVSELLRWPGILKQAPQASSVLSETCLALIHPLIYEFNLARAREGERLKTVLLERLEACAAITAAVRPKLPTILNAYMNKLATRLSEALGNVDDDRLKQEFALFAQKMDIDEELSRLTTHLSEVTRILNKGGQVGKRIDFLMQELNREANTLGSKSMSPETTQAAVELKVLVEQMREQVQNIE